MYLIYGTSKLAIEEKIKEIISKNNIENVTKYSLEETALEEVIMDACYIDMFNDKKCIIANDSYFLTSSHKGEVDELSKYILNPNENTILIFTLNEEKLDERKKIVKDLKKVCEVYTFNTTDNKNIEKVIKSNLKEEGFTIEENALRELLNRTKTLKDSIINELEKLKLYKIKEKVITKSDVIAVVPKEIEDDVFALTNAISSKNKKEIFEIYNDLITSKKEPAMIIALLASTFRLYLSIKILLEEGKNKYEINEILKEHPYRIDLGIKESVKFKKNELIKYLTELYNLDKSIKTGENKGSLEMFFLEM